MKTLRAFLFWRGVLPIALYFCLREVLVRTETATVLLGAVAGAQWLGLLGMLCLLLLRVYTVLVFPSLLVFRFVRELSLSPEQPKTLVPQDHQQ